MELSPPFLHSVWRVSNRTLHLSAGYIFSDACATYENGNVNKRVFEYGAHKTLMPLEKSQERVKCYSLVGYSIK